MPLEPCLNEHAMLLYPTHHYTILLHPPLQHEAPLSLGVPKPLC